MQVRCPLCSYARACRSMHALAGSNTCRCLLHARGSSPTHQLARANQVEPRAARTRGQQEHLVMRACGSMLQCGAGAPQGSRTRWLA